MKILLIIHSVSWKGGGAFFHAMHIAKKISLMGNQVSIMATSPENKFTISRKEIEGVHLIEFPDLLTGAARNGWDFWNTFRRIVFMMERNKSFDIVHCLDCRPVVIFPGLFMKYFKRANLIIEWLDWFGRGGTASERSAVLRFFMEPVETFFEEKFRKYADGTISLGQPLSERAEKLGVRSRILTITHGCDIVNIQKFDINFAKSKVGLSEGTMYIGYSGRLREDAASLFISTVSKLRSKYSLNVHGIFIGNTAFRLEKYLGSTVEPYIHETGWVDYNSVNYFLCSCHILLLPFGSSVARNNIWPSKINDYLSAGRPIVATNLKVLERLFAKSNIGIVSEPDGEKLADACYKILENSKEQHEMGSNARRLAETDFEWTTIAERINSFYTEVISSKQ